MLPLYVGLLWMLYIFSCNAINFSSKKVINHVSHARSCELCGLTFKRIPEYDAHLLGKRHKDMMLSSDPVSLWNEFKQSHWSKDCSPEDVSKPFDINELSSLGLKYRTNCLSPSPTMKNLEAHQRARIWR